MSDNQILIQKNINLYKDCSDGIVFAHKKTLDESAKYPLHLNRYFEVYILAEGSVDYIVEGSCFQLSAGDIVIISPYEVHRPCINSFTWYERFYFLIPTNAFDYMIDGPVSALTEIHNSVGNFISPPAEEKKKMLKLLNTISSHACEDGLSAKLIAYAAFINILAMINMCRTHSNDLKNVIPAEGLPQLLSDILIYIDGNLTAIGSISELANHFNVSAPYLSALFKKKLGIKISDYIRTRKIGCAKQLLDKGNDVTAACFGSGFNDCSYFTKVFKACVGMTPRQYKRQG